MTLATSLQLKWQTGLRRTLKAMCLSPTLRAFIRSLSFLQWARVLAAAVLAEAVMTDLITGLIIAQTALHGFSAQSSDMI